MTTTTRPSRATYTPAPTVDDQPLFEEEPAAAPQRPMRRIALRFQGIYDGFPVEVEMEGYSLAEAAALLRLRGVTPAAQPSAAPAAQSEAPLCRDHGTPMKTGKFGYYCPKKEGDTYCSRKAK